MKKFSIFNFQFSIRSGFTLIELLVVIAILGVLIGVLITVINPAGQLGKARDAQRKSDLHAMQSALDAYSNDTTHYPPGDGICGLGIPNVTWGSPWPGHIGTVPKDPLSTQSYCYKPDNTNGSLSGYYLYAIFEHPSDSQAIAGLIAPYNYGVSSSNLTVGPVTAPIIPTATTAPVAATATPTPTITATPTVTPTPTPALSIVFRSMSTNISDNNQSSFAIQKPSNVAQNDVMLAHIAVSSNNNIIVPSGWSLVTTVRDTVDNYRASVYYKVAGASEPSSYTWTISGGPWWAGAIVAYSGVDTTNPIHVGNAANGLTTPSSTTTIPNTMLVAFFRANTSSTFTPPSGMTERFDIEVTVPYITLEGTDAVQSTAGAIGTKTAIVANGTTTGTAVIVALKPIP